MRMGRNRGRVSLYGRTEINMMANSTKTTSKEKEHTLGPTDESTWGSGSTIKCRARECSHGQMVAPTKATIRMIKKRAMEFSFGPMAANMSATG